MNALNNTATAIMLAIDKAHGIAPKQWFVPRGVYDELLIEVDHLARESGHFGTPRNPRDILYVSGIPVFPED